MERRGTNVTPSAAPAVDDRALAVARIAFADWLRAARETRGIPLEEVARVTKIQIRTLERLEEARFDELPADVFVRGFLRNYARVVGVDADEALVRYDDCGTNPGPAAAAKARAVAEMFSAPKPAPVQPRVLRAVATPPAGTELAAGSLTEIAIPVPEPTIEVVEAAPVAEEVKVEEAPKAPKKTSRKRGGKGRSRSKRKTESAEAIALQEPTVDDFEITITEEPPAPAPVLVVPPPAFRGRVTGRGPVVTPIPSLVIDDDDPESAERVREARTDGDKHEHRSFLPKALLDSDRGRQGGLTLAVIILLIVATLTLSYLMRRPSAGGEGVTMNDTSDVHATLT